MRNKANFFGFYLDDDDANFLRKKIKNSGLKKSEYLSRMCLERNLSMTHPLDAGKFKAVYSELLRQGNNLNQIARRLNVNEKASLPYQELLRTYREVIEVCQS